MGEMWKCRFEKRYLYKFVLLVVLIILLLVPLSISAQTNCDQPVTDEANAFGGNISQVQDAASRLISTGADVRVRMIPTYGTAGNLDRYESFLEEDCPSWTDASGNRKNNLVVVLVALTERQTGIYYGSQWEQALSSQYTRIQTDIMNPRFSQGDYTGGVVAGLNEINRLIEAQISGQSVPPRSGGLSTGSIALIVILFIAVLTAGWLILRNSRKHRERRLAARQKALLAKQGAASRVNELVDAVQMLEIKVNALAAKIAPEEAATLLEGLAEAKRVVDQNAQNYSELGHSAGNPETPNLSEGQLQVIAQEYQKVLDSLRGAGDEISKVNAKIADIQQAADSFPARLNEINSSLEAVVRKQDEARNSGFKTIDSEVELSRARQTLEQARALAQKKLFLQAANKLTETREAASRAARSIDDLPIKKKETEEAIGVLESRISQVQALLTRGRGAFDRISSSYADSSWESIRGNGTEAENRIDWTLEALEKARSLATMQQQEWSQALGLVKQGQEWLDEAESFLHSISALESNLAEALKAAPGEIAAAQADINRAWQYINTYDEDIRESLEDDLREAEKKLQAADEELKQEKTDSLKAVKLAKEANESADKILIQARSEHEAAERERARAAVALREARSKLSIAAEYIADHHTEAGDEAKRLLVNASAALQQAEAVLDLENRIALAEKAESEAEKAYTSARSRVEEERERRQPVFPGVIVLPGGGSRSQGSSWGSRRSSPWGSGGGGMGGGRGGGGGSTGWGGGRGGGGRGGGGSTGW